MPRCKRVSFACEQSGADYRRHELAENDQCCTQCCWCAVLTGLMLAALITSTLHSMSPAVHPRHSARYHAGPRMSEGSIECRMRASDDADQLAFELRAETQPQEWPGACSWQRVPCNYNRSSGLCWKELSNAILLDIPQEHEYIRSTCAYRCERSTLNLATCPAP